MQLWGLWCSVSEEETAVALLLSQPDESDWERALADRLQERLGCGHRQRKGCRKERETMTVTT
jgi:hypothetical protein